MNEVEVKEIVENETARDIEAAYKYYKRIFAKEGVVNYNDGLYLIQKEALDNALNSIKGQKIFLTHDGGRDKNKDAVGVVVDCYYDIK